MPKIALPSKPGADIAYELFPGDSSSKLLLIFLNGLGAPQTAWKPTIDLVQQSSFSPLPRMITYDRYGQLGGTSARDPREQDPNKESGYAHTLDDVTDDLEELIATLSPDRHDRIVLVNNSIGAHIARRYAERHPGVVEGILFLDSNPGNVEFSDFLPAPGSSSVVLPEGCSAEQFAAAYKKLVATFNSDVKNGEGFDRRKIKHIYPDPSRPKLVGSKTSNIGPWVTVVGHELQTIMEQEWQFMQIPIGLSALYTQPMWEKYNEGLCRMTDAGRAKGPLIAPKAGHFIQKDNPEFVSKQVLDLLRKVEGQH